MGDLGKALAGFTVGFTGSYANTLSEQDKFDKEQRSAQASDLRAKSLAQMKDQNQQARDEEGRVHDEKMVGLQGDQTQSNDANRSALMEDRQIAAEGRAIDNQAAKDIQSIDAFFSKIDAVAGKMEEQGATTEQIAMYKLKAYGVAGDGKPVDANKVVDSAQKMADQAMKEEAARRVEESEPPLSTQNALNMRKDYVEGFASLISGEVNRVAGKNVMGRGGPKPTEPTEPTGTEKSLSEQEMSADRINAAINAGQSVKKIKSMMKEGGQSEKQINDAFTRFESKFEKVRASWYNLGYYKGKG